MLLARQPVINAAAFVNGAVSADLRVLPGTIDGLPRQAELLGLFPDATDRLRAVPQEREQELAGAKTRAG